MGGKPEAHNEPKSQQCKLHECLLS